MQEQVAQDIDRAIETLGHAEVIHNKDVIDTLKILGARKKSELTPEPHVIGKAKVRYRDVKPESFQSAAEFLEGITKDPTYKPRGRQLADFFEASVVITAMLKKHNIPPENVDKFRSWSVAVLTNTMKRPG